MRAILPGFAALLLAAPAFADTVNFQVVGNGDTITFSLPSIEYAQEFPLFNFFTEQEQGVVDGVSQTLAESFYAPFFTAQNSFDVSYGATTLHLYGSHVETTLASNMPGYYEFEFVPGTYSLMGNYTYGAGPMYPYTVTITSAASTVTPEPASVVLLMLGAGPLAFGVVRRRFLH